MTDSNARKTLLTQLRNVGRPVFGAPVKLYLNQAEYDLLLALLEEFGDVV
jgi:hypothetical protein